MSCSNSNCAEIQAKYNESIKEGQILCRKMKDYQKELSQYEAWMKESDRQQRDACIMHEATFRQLISDLDALVRCEDTERVAERLLLIIYTQRFKYLILIYIFRRKVTEASNSRLSNYSRAI